MTEEKLMLLVLKDTIGEASPEDQKQIEDTAEKLRAVVKQAGDLGTVAITLVGLELAAKN